MTKQVATVAIFSLLALIAIVWGMGQISQHAYQDGLRAGKASAQDVAYNQGYEVQA